MAINQLNPLPRKDQRFLIVTVLKTKNNYELKVKKPVLAPNQFCYRLEVVVDPKEWFNRIADVVLPRMTPPEAYRLNDVGVDIGQSNAEEVMDRLKGIKT